MAHPDLLATGYRDVWKEKEDIEKILASARKNEVEVLRSWREEEKVASEGYRSSSILLL